MAYKEREQGNIIKVTKKQYNDLNNGLSVKGYKKTNKDILVPSFSDIYSIEETDNKIDYITAIAICTYKDGKLSISDSELAKIYRRYDDRLFLGMTNYDTQSSEIFKLVSYGNPENQGTTEYIFSNGVHEIHLNIMENEGTYVVDKFLLFEYISSTAQYAMYASTDTSKGTIEERLTKLGFSKGSFGISGFGGNTTVYENSIKKQGKYVIAHIRASNFISINVPNEMLPKENTYVSAYGVANNGKYIAKALITTKGGINFLDRENNTITSSIDLIDMINVGWEIN